MGGQGLINGKREQSEENKSPDGECITSRCDQRMVLIGHISVRSPAKQTGVGQVIHDNQRDDVEDDAELPKSIIVHKAKPVD